MGHLTLRRWSAPCPSSPANKALIAIADQPIDKAEGKDRGRERERLRRICFLQIENDNLAAIASSAIISTERIWTTLSRHMIDRAPMFALTMIVGVDCTP